MSDDWPPSGDERGLAARFQAVPEEPDTCRRCGASIRLGEFCEGCAATVDRRRVRR